MLYTGIRNGEGANVLVPIEDYSLAIEKEKKVDLSRVQLDV